MIIKTPHVSSIASHGANLIMENWGMAAAIVAIVGYIVLTTVFKKGK